jgi:hypothetical protein
VAWAPASQPTQRLFPFLPRLNNAEVYINDGFRDDRDIPPTTSILPIIAFKQFDDYMPQSEFLASAYVAGPLPNNEGTLPDEILAVSSISRNWWPYRTKAFAYASAEFIFTPTLPRLRIAYDYFLTGIVDCQAKVEGLIRCELYDQTAHHYLWRKFPKLSLYV